MRQRFEVQLALGQIPIERVHLPLKSRDELPPILAGLQWIFQTPEVNEQVFALLESKVVGGKKATGRPGLNLWPILVLGVVRLGLDCDYDRLEDLANHHTLLRQILGLPPVPLPDEKPFHYKTLSENVCHLDEETLAQINSIIAQAGRAVFKKKEEPIRAKTDSYVLETNVHFPTDLNLLWDAQRKCLDLIGPIMARPPTAWLAQSQSVAAQAQKPNDWAHAAGQRRRPEQGRAPPERGPRVCAGKLPIGTKAF